MWIQARAFTSAQLGRFATHQRGVYAVLEQSARELRPGDTEREAARRLHRALVAELAIDSYFHVPVVLFGERTGYPGDFGPFAALPTERRWEAGEAAIFDAAPVIEGYTIDASLARPPARGAAAVAFAAGDALLARLRGLILDRARGARDRRGNMREIAREVDREIQAAGFENCHRKHIAAVLGHRVTITHKRWLARTRVWGLSPLPVAWFVERTARSAREPAASPNWNHTRRSDAALPSGVWAIEPHVARDGVGVKFEELLVVDDDGVRFLDDALPHVARWTAIN
jgi:hypothetical protein